MRLLLARKPKQHVVMILADGRTIGVQVDFARNRKHMKLAFEAPADVRIMRPEIDESLRGLHFTDTIEEDSR